MTSKAYLVSWLGKGNIVWTPIDSNTSSGVNLFNQADGPIRHALDLASQDSELASHLQQIVDPSMAGLNAIQTTVNLAAGLSICTVGLQMATLTQTFRMMQTIREVDRKVGLIDGKFELHFLDRSLDFFLQSHQNAAGLFTPIAAALEEDCYNAMQTLVAHEDLKIPSYLRLKLLSQAQAIESWNQLQYSVIHDGSLPKVSENRIDKWVRETDLTTKSLPPGGYASQASILESCRKSIANATRSDNWLTKFNKSGQRTLLEKALSPDVFERVYPVLLLAREIQATLEYAEALEEKLLTDPTKRLLIRGA